MTAIIRLFTQRKTLAELPADVRAAYLIAINLK